MPPLLPRAQAVIEQGVEQGLHHGAQLYVSLRGETILDTAFGDSHNGPLSSDHWMLWLSAGKPLTAALAAKFQQQSRLQWDDPVARYLPEFAAGGKESITIFHLLTHTSGIRNPKLLWPRENWRETLDEIYQTPLEEGWKVGESGGYDKACSWFVLGALLESIGGRPFSQLLREELLLPCGLENTYNGIPQEVYHKEKERIAGVYMREIGSRELVLSERHEAFYASAPAPGGNTRGPIRELGRFYEMLLKQGDGVLTPETVAAMTTRHRTDTYDHTFMHKLDFGLGVVMNSNRYGADTIAYGFGPYCSEETFGHGGAQSSLGFADPQAGLAVAYAFNGMPGKPRHQKRARALNAAIYEDLGLNDLGLNDASGAAQAAR